MHLTKTRECGLLGPGRQKKAYTTIMGEMHQFGNGERVEVRLRNGYVLCCSRQHLPLLRSKPQLFLAIGHKSYGSRPTVNRESAHLLKRATRLGRPNLVSCARQEDS